MDGRPASQGLLRQGSNSSQEVVLLMLIVRPLAAREIKTCVELSCRWATVKHVKMDERLVKRGLVHQELSSSRGHVLLMPIVRLPAVSGAKESAELFFP